jgi:hypothetical protein
MPEYMLLVDNEKTIHIMKGETYGKSFNKFIEYKKDGQDEAFLDIEEIHTLCLV